MFATITPLITRGVIDNTRRDRITLQLWCVDGGEPIEYEMSGNCRLDISGCRVEFTNRFPAEDEKETPDILRDMRRPGRSMTAGDITLSRRGYERNNRRARTNALYIEFFSGSTVRFLIETTDFDFDISLPQWKADSSTDNLQHLLNMEAFRNHIIGNAKSFRGPALSTTEEEFPRCFWDVLLNEAEAYMAIYPTVVEKYTGERNGALSAAYVMGRVDFLAQAAAEDEAEMPPDPEAVRFECEVTDFVPEEHREALKKAMLHYLFRETSKVTTEVQQQLAGNTGKGAAGEGADTFLKVYAALVSNILASIMLTRQAEFNYDLLHARSRSICRRLAMLAAHCRNNIPEKYGRDLPEACLELAAQVQEFTKSLHP